MRNIRKLLPFAALAGLTMVPTAGRATGTWTAMPAYAAMEQAVQMGDLLYVRSETGNIFTYDLTDQTTHALSRLTGLTGSTVACMAGDTAHSCLALVFDDGDIDLLHPDGSLTNLPDLKNKTLADKTLFDARIVGKRLYIAGGYGFSIVDLEHEVFADSYLFGENCYYAYDQDGTLYMATDDGLSACPMTANAYDRTAWQLVQTSIPAAPDNGTNRLDLLGEVALPGPGNAELYQLDYVDGRLSGVACQPNYYDSNDFSQGMLSTYHPETGLWTNITRSSLRNCPEVNYAFQGLTSLAIDPKNPERCAVGTLYMGLCIIEGDSVVEHYDETNSNLETYWKARVSRLAYDDNGVLWMGNPCKNSAALKALLPDGTWMDYPISGFDGGQFLFVRAILVTRLDPYGFKWISKSTGGCAMYYDAGTPADKSDDESCCFSTLTDQDGNATTPSFFNAFAEDRDGAVWILTSSGPFVSDSPLETYTTKGTVRRIKIPRNDGTNLADYLLANVDTRCIVVDAANRKWIGTAENGLYLLSADGLTTIEHFTTDNSPLFSNQILDLAMDQESGRLFISTPGGVLIYESGVAEGAKDFSAVYCYPNPVRPEYSGDLTITGLMDATQVRITDINNNVIYAATSAGNSVTWNLCNRSGKRVKAGVYLVYGVDEAGKKGMVSKVMVVR